MVEEGCFEMAVEASTEGLQHQKGHHVGGMVINACPAVEHEPEGLEKKGGRLVGVHELL